MALSINLDADVSAVVTSNTHGPNSRKMSISQNSVLDRNFFLHLTKWKLLPAFLTLCLRSALFKTICLDNFRSIQKIIPIIMLLKWFDSKIEATNCVCWMILVISYNIQIILRFPQKWLAKKVIMNQILSITMNIFFGKNKTKILDKVHI